MASASPSTIVINNLLPYSGFSEVTDASAGAQLIIAYVALAAETRVETATPIVASRLGSICGLLRWNTIEFNWFKRDSSSTVEAGKPFDPVQPKRMHKYD